MPTVHDLKLGYVLSIVVGIILSVLSLGGLLYSSVFYPTDELVQSFLANDVVNLLIGLPFLAGSMWLTRRGSLVGLLLWPGAMLYILYNYIVSLTGTPLSYFTLPYLLIVALCAYSIYGVLRSVDRESVKDQISQGVPRRIGGWILVVFGFLFIIRGMGIILEASINQTILPISEIGLLIADIALSIPSIAGGVLLLRRKPLGYASGLGLLFAESMLFIGLIMVLFLQPVFTDVSFEMIDVVLVLVMGLIFFFPTGFFLRGVVKSERTEP